MKRFGEKLHTLRKQQGWTLKQLGERLDISDSYVGRMEKGKKTPNVAMLVKIADLFEVSLDNLIRDERDLD